MLSSYSLFFVAFVSLIPRVALAQEPASRTLSGPISDESDSGVSNESSITERRFVQSFVSRRKEHLKAVKNIRNMKSYEKQYKMVSILAENALNVVESSRAVIGATKFVRGDSEPLKNITVRAALSTILENCALFGDVVLQLPDITHRAMRSQRNWKSTIHWGLKFVNETRHLLDEPTLAMFDLVRQELKIIPRDPTYTNPYWSEDAKRGTTNGDKKKYSKDTRRKKGPQMVNIEL